MTIERKDLLSLGPDTDPEGADSWLLDTFENKANNIEMVLGNLGAIEGGLLPIVTFNFLNSIPSWVSPKVNQIFSEFSALRAASANMDVLCGATILGLAYLSMYQGARIGESVAKKLFTNKMRQEVYDVVSIGIEND